MGGIPQEQIVEGIAAAGEVTVEWKIRQHNFSSMVARHSKSDDQTRARLQRADVIERLRRKFRVLAYRLGGQDWKGTGSRWEVEAK